ncbi:nectin 1a-like [Paramisgurnus dabryanus]|uniref:nectin 1a-like n=1 Tax=Paramisgurnus dabryanus TaxID=90735 RepID=UPI0031F3B062
MMDLFSKFIPLLLSYTTLLTELQGQRVDIVSEISVYQSDDVTLPCRFVHGHTENKLIQVEWFWRNPSNKNVSIRVILFNEKYGIYLNNTFLKDRVNFSTNPNLTFEASIIIKHVKLTDQGVYSCGYTTYPRGKQIGVTTLKVQEGKLNLLSTAATARIVTVILITVILTSVGYFFINKRRRAASTSVNYITQSPDDLQQGEITYANVPV